MSQWEGHYFLQEKIIEVFTMLEYHSGRGTTFYKRKLLRYSNSSIYHVRMSQWDGDYFLQEKIIEVLK